MNKELRYQKILKTAGSLLSANNHPLSNMANLARLISEEFNFHWVGFYISDGSKLILGPYNGPLACTEILFSKGVCGHSFSTEETIIVDDVHKFEGHIACSALSQSEIVVPLKDDAGTWAVLDIDSDKKADFDKIDQDKLELLVKLITRFKLRD